MKLWLILAQGDKRSVEGVEVTMSDPQLDAVEPVFLAAPDDPNDREAWQRYWQSQGCSWRREPKIPVERQH